jgi:small basic protein (TIGR04137 family)
MTMDSSLRIRAGSSSTRSVLTRVERIAKLKEAERWKDGQSPLGLPKVRVYKLAMKKKKVKSKEEADAAKPGAKGGAAKPAAGAKAPAAKPAAKK